ncbi:YhgE/Pip domain-containing protein [Tsukamurella soli]|uniref:YhgE/Pip domain-containing protein n=1 Tax=Tsukamurella soli TaxID=644556 RepID=A0ABP8JXR1_9ACTN
MLAGLAFGSEIKRFGRSRMTRAAIVVLMLLPLVYGALYLWAFWNPFGNVNKMPVALVNADRGTVVAGQQIDAGAEVAKSLTADGSLDWHVVDESAARSGVKDGKYYFMVELPPNFSEAIASPLTGKPQKADLIAMYNDANNYISSTIGQTAVGQILNAVSTRISGQAVNQVLSVVISAGSGIKQAADGAKQLADGATQLDTGIGQADDGAGQLASGLDTARSGSAQLASGAKQLSDGIDQATDPLLAVTKALSLLGGNTAQLQQGATAIAAAADQMGALSTAQDTTATVLASVIRQLTASRDPVARGAAASLSRLQGQLAQHSFTPALRQQIAAAQTGAIALTSALRTPGSPLQTALDQAAATGTQLTGKLNQLRDGAHQLAAGNAQLASGIVQLDNGAKQLKSGTAQLEAGSTKLAAGNTELATKLADGAKAVPNWSPQQKDAIADTIGGPVSLKATHENAAGNFGTGMAPFFLTLALFFGALVLWMVLRPLQTRPIAAEVLAIRVVLASYLPAAAIAVLQAVILYCVVRFALGLTPQHPGWMLAFMVLVSLTFVAATQAINALVGPAVGRVLIMALLMLQLVSSGGMYPVETTSKPFQVLHHYDPMTYGVNGLRQLVLGGIDYRLWQAVIVLFGIWALALAISCLSARRNRLWNLTRLLPAIKI